MKKYFSLDARSRENMTPLYMASSNGYYEIVQLLISNGCKITSKSYKRETAIGVAQRLGDINMVKLLESYVENNG